MEVIRGANNWKMVIRRSPREIAILQAHTCDPKASLPDELFGLPVRMLGDHALAPGRRAPEGEQVLMTCGPVSEGAWDNGALVELQLPKDLRSVGNYCFFNCKNLTTLRMGDTVTHWGAAAMMNCRRLNTFHLSCGGQEGFLLSELAGELTGELDVTLNWGDDRLARIIFPEYSLYYEENVPHHQFDFRIQGAGYPYHHCFYNKKFSLHGYDELWKGFLGMAHEPQCAMRMAWWRLWHPVELTQQAASEYERYLARHAVETAQWLLEERNAQGLAALLSRSEWDRGSLAQLCQQARETNAPELLAMLLEEQHRRFPSVTARHFDL